MMNEVQQGVGMDESPEAIIRQARQGWRKQFDKALQVEETDSAEQLEWLEIPLATDEDWEW